MENFKVVRPIHLNHYGYLFGGDLLKWVDEISWIAASRDYPGCKFVTVSMDRVEFKRSVRQGSVLRFDVNRHRQGRTSVQYEVTVYCDDLDSGREEQVFSTHVTFVCLDAAGKTTPLPDA
jgi:acyl-CoA hydrolase